MKDYCVKVQALNISIKLSLSVHLFYSVFYVWMFYLYLHFVQRFLIFALLLTRHRNLQLF
jgi:hypothetical protein